MDGRLERFNTTFQDKYLLRIPTSFKSYQIQTQIYLYYNNKRQYMAL